LTMAPKADSKAKAKAEGKAKAKKEKKEGEEEKPRMEEPDQKAFDEKYNAISAQIDKIKKDQQAISAELSGKNEGKEEFFAEKAKIQNEFNEVKSQMDALYAKKEEIAAALGGKKAERAEMTSELGKLKKSMTYTNEEDIDKRIKQIGEKMSHDSLTIKQEKEFMKEIQDLKKQKPKLQQLAGMQDKASNLDRGGDLVEQRNVINEQLVVLKAQKQEILDRRSKLEEGRKAKQGTDGDGLREKRENFQKKVQELIEKRTALKTEFQEEKAKFRQYLQEQREARNLKWAEEKKARDAAWELQKLEKKVAALDEQPHVAEMTLIDQTIKFCNDLLPQSTTAAKEESKETTYNNKDNETVLLKKEDRDEEMFFAPTKKKKGKGAPKAGADGKPDAGKKPIKHNAETFMLFDKLKLDAPITTADIPALLEKLEAQKKSYEEKVKVWSETKEEMKRKIKAGEITADDLDDSGKEKSKEAEKEEEKEAEKDEA